MNADGLRAEAHQRPSAVCGDCCGRLPLDRLSGATTKTVGTRNVKDEKIMDHSTKPRILVVDDNPFNRDLLKEFLKPEGFFVEEGRNGREALERLQESEFHLIFMDLLMPGMDGFETIQRIRRMGVTTPIIIVSSMSAREDRQRCLEAGGDDFLPKPINVERVRELLDQYKADPSASFPKVRGPDTSPDMMPSHHHILLIEEDDTLADRYERFLRQTGFNVTRVFNGDEAYERFLKHPNRFHIIISNVFTSGMDGFGILAKIKRDHLRVLVFLYAEAHDPDTFQLAIELGADGVLTQGEFEASVPEMIESAAYRTRGKEIRTQSALTASQVREAQEQLIRYGCPEPCDTIDIAYSPLTDAGGDLACCRRFNLAGRCGIILGDVSGHNVVSSYISAIFLGMLTSNWARNQKPLNLLRLINGELDKSNYGKYHLCATALLWDRCRQRLDIATAGNPGALLVTRHPDGSLNFHELAGGGMCLGLLKEDHLFLSEEIDFPGSLPPGTETHLFFFSDGIDKEEIIRTLSSGSVRLDREHIRGLSQEILEDILEKRGQDDDMVIIALGRMKDEGGRMKSSFTPHPDKRRRGQAPDKRCRGQASSFIGECLHHPFPSTYKAADQACRWAMHQCVPDWIPRGMDPCLIFLAVREALINAVSHGNQFDPDAFVDLSLFFRPKELRMDISDEGPGFDLPDDIRKIEDVNVLQAGGRGLSAMYSVADSIEVNGGTISLIFREVKREA